ncbi:MAG: L,D-transpeptidase family protein [Rhodospirillales bacterium]|nr:L,D-transpeptidase family protein [Rhodospirillales bacterium]
MPILLAAFLVLAAALTTGAPLVASQPAAAASPATEKADSVLVVKSERRLYLLRDGAVIATYRVSLGQNPLGHKFFQGDGRTPEGVYRLDGKNDHSRFYRSIKISYPNPADRQRARKYGGPPGGDIMLHGQPSTDNVSALKRIAQSPTSWTDGCIAVENWAMDEIWAAVDNGTPIEIVP